MRAVMLPFILVSTLLGSGLLLIYAPQAGLWIIGGVLMVLIYAFFSEPIWNVLYSGFEPLRTAGSSIENLQASSTRIGEQSVSLWKEEGISSRGEAIGRVVGIMFSFLIFCACVFSDYFLVSLSLAAFSAEDSALPLPDISTEFVIGLCVVACPIYWAMLISDLAGHTNFGPWQSLSPEQQKTMGIMAMVLLVLFIGIAMLLAVYRSYSMSVPIYEYGNADPIPAGEIYDYGLDDLSDLRQQAESGDSAMDIEDVMYDSERVTRLVTTAVFPTLAAAVAVTAAVAKWGVQGLLMLIVVSVLKLLQLSLFIASFILSLMQGILRWLALFTESIHNLIVTAGTVLLELYGLKPINQARDLPDNPEADVQEYSDSLQLPQDNEQQVSDGDEYDLASDDSNIIDLDERVARDDHKKWSPFNRSE